MPITSTEFVNRIIFYYNDRDNWTYCHGSTGYIVGASDNRVKNLYEYYLRIGKNSTNIPYATWYNEHKGKRTCDCSNFINLTIFGYYCASNWSVGAFTKMEQLKEPIPGAIAWKSGHVGVCISVDDKGNGTYIHMPTYERTFEKFTDNEDMWHPKSYWSGYCKLPSSYVSYSTIPVITPVPKSIMAVVNGKYKVGKILTATDFTVKVTMTDGSVLTNPPYWTASPLTLTSSSNTIKVTYKNVSTTIIVPAEADKIAAVPNKQINYRVCVGQYSSKEEADKGLLYMKAKGYNVYVVKINNVFRLQAGLYSNKAYAESLNNKLKSQGFESIIIES